MALSKRKTKSLSSPLRNTPPTRVQGNNGNRERKPFFDKKEEFISPFHAVNGTGSLHQGGGVGGGGGGGGTAIPWNVPFYPEP